MGAEEKRPLIIIDKQAFERTLESFDKSKKAGKTDQHCLTEIQKKKQKLITQIQEDISEIENNIDNEGESEEQDTSIMKESGETTNCSIPEESTENTLPTWLQLYLERADQHRKHEELIRSSASNTVSTGSTQEELKCSEPTTIEVTNNTLHDGVKKEVSSRQEEETIMDSDSQEFKKRIEHLKKMFVPSLSSKEEDQSVRKFLKYISVNTDRVKQKFEHLNNEDPHPQNENLSKGPPKKLLDMSPYLNIMKDSSIEKDVTREIKKWKWKESQQQIPASIANTEVDNKVVKEDSILGSSDIDDLQLVIKKYLDLIEDDDNHTESSKIFTKSEKIKAPAPLDKTMVQDLFKDQATVPKPLNKVGKLSKSLSFLNGGDDNKCSQRIKDESLISNLCETKKTLIERKINPMEEKVDNNRVKKKIVENPFHSVKTASEFKVLDTQSKSSDNNRKVWKPKPPPRVHVPVAEKEISDKGSTNNNDQSSSFEDFRRSSPEKYLKTFPRKIEVDEENEGIDEILNYEDSEEIKQYEEELRAKYQLDEDIQYSSHQSLNDNQSTMKPADSFSSLMNILTTMRKSRLSKSVSECKLNLFGSKKNSHHKQEQIGYCEEYESPLTSCKERKVLYESSINSQKPSSMLDDELEEIRKLRSVRSIDSKQSSSHMDLSQSRVSQDLDEEILSLVSRNNTNVRSHFEASAPKYKFGGSMSNLSFDACKAQEPRKVVHNHESHQLADKRTWVLDSIHKHFEIIVEDEEDEYSSDTDAEDEESEDDEDCISLQSSAGESSMRTSDQMKSLVQSVVCQITTKDQNLKNSEILSNLKEKLSSYATNTC